jgi:ATP-dependent DNA helicase DinG
VPQAPKTITDLLREAASALPNGGEERSGQAEMAEAVGRAIANRRNLVVQAGTGTGKSLAYLIPAVRAGRKVVVATATKALQDQLANKDLPFVAGLRPPGSFSFAVLKGRSNYLCRQRASETGLTRTGSAALPLTLSGESGLDGGPGGAIDGGQKLTDQIRRLVAWGESSPTGDRSELDFEPDPKAWSAVSVGSRECPGAFRCPSGSECFTEAARARAAAADVVVVNTHLYASHVASGGAVLPEHDVVVLDEAHEVEDVMTEGLGVELTPGRIRALVQGARGLVGSDDQTALEELAEIADRLDSAIRPHAGKRLVPEKNLEQLLESIASRLSGLIAALRRADRNQSSDPDESNKRVRSLQAASHLAEDTRAIAAAGDDHVAWVESSGPAGRFVALRLAPIDIGPELALRLWPNVTAVLTSATIPRIAQARLGLPADTTDRLDVASPFPYAQHALLYCATRLPDRRSAQAEDAIADELCALITAAGGRTLALFTSWRAMTSVCSQLRGVLDFPIYAQGDLPKPRLLEEFGRQEAACLFATVSFWQGVDIPGRTLSLVAVDRLPFARPDDPLVQARRERAGERAFNLVDLPRAAMLLAQGAGRLIRSSDDSGVVAVLDKRLATAAYGRVLRASLPPMRWTTDRRVAVDFLEKAVADHG